MNPGAVRPTALGSVVRALTVAGAILLTMDLIAGIFYACSVDHGLAVQPDARYVATMPTINERIQNPLFFLSFFGAVFAVLAALAAQFHSPRSVRFWLVCWLAHSTWERITANGLRVRADGRAARRRRPRCHPGLAG